MHEAARGQPRGRRVVQVRNCEPSVADFVNYVPTESAVRKVCAWATRGAQIAYLSSRLRDEAVAADMAVLARSEFPPGEILHRREGETYVDLLARARLDILVEDDCESIGGAALIIYPNLPAANQQQLRSVVVREFEGLSSLPDDPRQLGLPEDPESNR